VAACYDNDVSAPHALCVQYVSGALKCSLKPILEFFLCVIGSSALDLGILCSNCGRRLQVTACLLAAAVDGDKTMWRKMLFDMTGIRHRGHHYVSQSHVVINGDNCKR